LRRTSVLTIELFDLAADAAPIVVKINIRAPVARPHPSVIEKKCVKIKKPPPEHRPQLLSRINLQEGRLLALLLVTGLTQALLPLVRGDLMALPLASAWHRLHLGLQSVIGWNIGVA